MAVGRAARREGDVQREGGWLGGVHHYGLRCVTATTRDTQIPHCVVTVDQPPGTGFSYVATDDYAKTVKEVQAHLLEFMKNFYQVFPEYKYADVSSRPLFPSIS